MISKILSEIKLRFDILQRVCGLHDDVSKAFFEDGEVWKSVQTSLFSGVCETSDIVGTLYELDEKEKELVKKFEKENGGKVYHIILSKFMGQLHYSFLYVSKYEEEWMMDKQDLTSCCPIVYVYNSSDPEMSEYGSIWVKEGFGGIIRVG